MNAETISFWNVRFAVWQLPKGHIEVAIIIAGIVLSVYVLLSLVSTKTPALEAETKGTPVKGER